MKITKKALLILFTICIAIGSNAQEKWFSTFSDSNKLVKEADGIVNKVHVDIKKINPDIILPTTKVIKNTTPYLIYVDLEIHTINLPLWSEVIPEQKAFFAEVAGGDVLAKEVFGLFFNGFYLVHEYGHAFAESNGKRFDNAFDSEYEANSFAILYWRSIKKHKELKSCYNFAKSMLQKLKNPVPANEDYKAYMTAHYDELSSDPYKYGYIQFSQFVEIYEKSNLGNFKTFVKNYKK